MPNKKDRILEFGRDVPASEVADELGTSEGYVYKVRSNHRRSDPGQDAETASGPSGDVTGMDTDITDMDAPDGDATDESDPLADLVIQDEYESYECGECGAELEYLANECPECGVEPAWWSE